jgi:chemotaxis protein methyltransferase CheR
MCPKEILSFFAKYIEHELGIVYGEENYFQLQNRLEELSRLLGVKSTEELFLIAKKGIDGTLRATILDIATNNETSFFRDPRVFRSIECHVVPGLVSSGVVQGQLRVWSAASSTGQEALSVSIMLSECSRGAGVKLPYSILATDVCDRVLERARAARYSQLEVQRGLSESLLARYFAADDQGRWQARPEVAKQIEFKKLNLLHTKEFPQGFHLILCRNVLIYQKVESKISILKGITSSLLPGGYLVLGSGESLLGLSDAYEQAELAGVVLYRKKRAC